MKLLAFFLLFFISVSTNYSQILPPMSDKSKNPLVCDIETGICVPDVSTQPDSVFPVSQSDAVIKIIYFTDPICSSCWGIEAQLRKLKMEYGPYFDMDYRMGGLLPDWSYNSGGISQASDVASHWEEASKYYDMPIDGDVWLEDPLDSSYPPSIAFKAAQMQDESKALTFMRNLRELLFLKKKNITKWEYIAQAAEKSNLNLQALKENYENGRAESLFKEDLALAKQMRVRGFPSLFFSNSNQDQQFVYGARPYEDFEKAILKLNPSATKQTYATDWENLFSKYPSWTVKEFALVSNAERSKVSKLLEEWVVKGKLKKYTTKNGVLYHL